MICLSGFRPNAKEGLLKLEDFPEAKVEKFGEAFIQVIKGFCEEHSLKINNFPDVEIMKVIVRSPLECHTVLFKTSKLCSF